MAADEAHGKAVTFQALNKEEARKMLVDEGLLDYKIVWESTPRTRHAEVTIDENGETKVTYKKL